MRFRCAPDSLGAVKRQAASQPASNQPKKIRIGLRFQSGTHCGQCRTVPASPVCPFARAWPCPGSRGGMNVTIPVHQTTPKLVPKGTLCTSGRSSRQNMMAVSGPVPNGLRNIWSCSRLSSSQKVEPPEVVNLDQPSEGRVSGTCTSGRGGGLVASNSQRGRLGASSGCAPAWTAPFGFPSVGRETPAVRPGPKPRSRPRPG